MSKEVALLHEPLADEATGKEKDRHSVSDAMLETRRFRTRILFTLFLFAVYLVHVSIIYHSLTTFGLIPFISSGVIEGRPSWPR